VSHMFKRVVSENRFKELRSLKDISKWLYYYLLFFTCWRVRYDRKLFKPYVPDIERPRSKRSGSCYNSGMSGKIP
jgi:hypothetical protein